MSGYGLPRGTQIFYGQTGFPPWVYQLAKAFNLKASTYPGHQEDDRRESGYAANPARQNRGIDWVGTPDDMDEFATYLLSIRGHLEQVIWEHPVTRRRVGVAGGKDVTSSAYYSSAWSGHRDHVHTRQSQPIPLPTGAQTGIIGMKPEYTEYPIWSPNGQSRNGTKIDLFLLHTQEGGSTQNGAVSLARWMASPSAKVSYHYAVSQDSNGHVTVIDTRDTDLASWSALSANNRSINLVFAGSRAAWTRDEWLRHADRSIDVAAWLAAEDCRKYGTIPRRVIKPPYGPPGGISDHRYVTKYLRDGTHTDVGGPMEPPWTGFPWDIFEQAFLRYTGQIAPVVPSAPKPISPPEPPIEESIMANARYESVSIYRTPGEGAKYTLAQLIQSIDGFAHRAAVEDAALTGSVDDIDRIMRVAAGRGAITDAWAVNHARKFLARLERENPGALVAYRESKGVA